MIDKKATNNFNAIRLIGAFIVIVVHSYGFLNIRLFILSDKINIGLFAVYTFISMSGYLVTQSFLERNSVVIYAINRILRIFPALICVVLFAMFVVGPLFTVLPLKTYFASYTTYRYLINISLMKLQFNLPGLFNGEVTNAPIWTLVYEFGMYIVVALFGVIGLLSAKPVAVTIQALLLAGAIYITYHYVQFNFRVAGFNVFAFAMFYQYFALGSIVYQFRQKIKFNIFILIALIIGWYFLIDTIFFHTATLVALSYLSFYVAFMPVKFGRFITRYGDFSYGLYLYGYLMQHIILVLFNPANVLLMIFLSLAFTIPCATLSWFFIEKKAMNLKKYLIQKITGKQPLAPGAATIDESIIKAG